MRSLIWKLAGALLLVVVISVGLMAFLTNLNTRNSFQRYVSKNNTTYLNTVSVNLGQYYSRGQTWNGVQNVLPDFERTMNDRIVVADNSGVIIGDTQNVWLGTIISQADIGSGTPVKVSGQTIGQVYLLSAGMGGMMGGMMSGGSTGSVVVSAAEQDFLNQVNRSIWITGVITFTVALLLGLFLAFQIIRPLRALIKGTRHISKGELDYRVNIKSNDELGELSRTFNSMTVSLENNELSRRRLTADIAHELRTPLTIIEGTVDGIIDGVFPSDPEHLNSIKEQTALLTRLIADLRDISLAESGQLKLSLADTDVIDLVRRKLSQIEPAAREKEVNLKLDAPGSLPAIKIDAGRMEQVINNLLTNALRYTPPGGTITASLETVAPGKLPQITKSGILITVADTGIGIAAEHLPLLSGFESDFGLSLSVSENQRDLTHHKQMTRED